MLNGWKRWRTHTKTCWHNLGHMFRHSFGECQNSCFNHHVSQSYPIKYTDICKLFPALSVDITLKQWIYASWSNSWSGSHPTVPPWISACFCVFLHPPLDDDLMFFFPMKHPDISNDSWFPWSLRAYKLLSLSLSLYIYIYIYILYTHIYIYIYTYT